MTYVMYFLQFIHAKKWCLMFVSEFFEGHREVLG